MRHMIQAIVLFFLILSLQSAQGMHVMHVKKVAGKKALNYRRNSWYRAGGSQRVCKQRRNRYCNQ